MNLHQNIRNAGFVDDKPKRMEKFKYSFRHSYTRIVSVVKKYLNNTSNYIIQKLRMIKYKEVLNDLCIWFLEVFLEGLTANFALHYLFNARFTLFTLFAYGILITQSISIIKRIVENKHGSDTKIHTENKPDE